MLHAPIAERSNSVPRDGAADRALIHPRARRLHAIDASRGAAMVLVCLSHFALKYIAPAGGDAPGGWLRFVGHIASPMFFIISGAMVGYLYTSRPETFAQVRSKLARRALFFLTAGHLLILGAHVQTLVDFTHTARILFVTDTIALALLVSPRLLTVPPRVRLIGAVAAYVASTALVFLWEPHGMAWRIIKDTVVGPDGPGSFWSYNVPILPWLAVHAAGTVLGGLLSVSISGDGRQRIEAQLVSVGCTLVAAAAAVRIICWWLIAHLLTPRGDVAVIARQLASPWNRLPPSPAHMLLFSGMALLGIAAIFGAERLHIFVRLTEWLGVVGQTSAFVFVFQFYVFYVFIPSWLPLHLALSPVIFLGAMLVIGGAARIWLHRRWRFSRASWFGDAAPGLPGAKR